MTNTEVSKLIKKLSTPPHENEALTEKSVSERLMEMAETNHISATAYSVVIARDKNSEEFDFSPKILAVEIDSDNKQYIPIYINKFRIIALIDSGADLTLIQEVLLDKILPNKIRKYEKGKEIKLMSASGDLIKSLGRLKVFVCFKPGLPQFTLTLTVVPTNPNTPTFIFGADALNTTDAILKFGTSPPKFIAKNPTYYDSPVYHYSPTQQQFCVGYCNLKPRDSASIKFLINKAAPLVRTDFILITSHSWLEVQILPSRSPVEFDYMEDCYTAYGSVVNLTDRTVKGLVWGRFEILHDKKVIPIGEGQRQNIKKYLKTHPLGREILPCNISHKVNIPILSCNKVSIKQGKYDSDPDVKIVDFDPEDTIMKDEPTYTGQVEITRDLIDPKGIELPTQVFANAAEAIDLSKYNEEIRPFIKSLFIEKYPQVVALHAIDAGDLSLTLGLTQIRLKPGEVLPKCKRIFHMSPTDNRHLDDICELLIKFGYLIRAPITPDGHHLYGMASYLVTRSKPGTLGRLIVDYSPINSLILSPPNIIPDISATLQFLQNKALYTSLDLKQAYLSLKVDAASRSLSTFITPTSAYQWTCIPTGMASSPAYWAEASKKMIHSEPVFDSDGNPIYECKNVVKLKSSPLPWVKHYFDDILSTSPLKATFHETLVEHFKILEELVKRLAFHGAKISFSKSEFAKGKILFLGWYVSNNFVMADPRRIIKIQNFKFPETKKAMRSFLGVINSLRRVIYLNILEDAHILTPLTSSTKPYAPTSEHRQIFEKIKLAMISEPLFNNLIDESAEKYLWVDASTTSGVVGAVLAQKKRGVPDQKIIPTCLDLDNPTHRVIFDRELNFEPVKIYTDLPITLPKPSAQKTNPPKVCVIKKFIEFEENNVHDSLFLGAASILAVYNCKPITSTIELRKLAVKEIKKGILGLKLRNFVFNNNYHKYKSYLDEFIKGQHNVDRNFYLVEGLAKALYRPIIIISNLPEHKESPIIKLNHGLDKPPLIFGVHEIENQLVFLPFFHNRNIVFCLDEQYQRIEIIGYMAKTVPEGMKAKGIMDIELAAILEALKNFNRLISNVPVTLLTDSKVLYYLFNTRIQDSCVKIKRWCLKVIGDYENVTIKFVKTTENLADFLTREGLPVGDIEKLNLKNIKINDFVDYLPKDTFTLKEWAQYCADHPEYLTITDTKSVYSMMQSFKQDPSSIDMSEQAIINRMIFSINQAIENVQEVITPLDVLRNRLSRAEIIKNQRKEFEKIYLSCLGGNDFEYIDDSDPTKKKYKLVNDLLMVYDNFYKICLPPSMIGLLLSFTHLMGHKGVSRMLADMENYYFPTKYTVTKKFIKSCYSCFLSHRSSRKSKLGVYPMPTKAFQEISVDLAENLNKVNGYSHLLIVKCALSGFTIIIPLATKSASEVNRALTIGVLQPFTVERIQSDNAKCFRSHQWLQLMAAWGITIINTSAINPSARGMAESEVNVIKLLMKKYLAVSKSNTYNWDMLTYIIMKAINYSKNPITGLTPASLVFGTEDKGPNFLNSEIMTPLHYSVKTDKMIIDNLTKEIKEMTSFAIEKITQARIVAHEKVNKGRVVRQWKPGDIVFVLDRMNIPGNPRPLKTRFHPSPYVVVRCLYNSTLIKRLADSFVALYANDHIKAYSRIDPLFATLPKEVSKVLLHKFQDFIPYDFTVLAEHDPLTIPDGITLFEPLDDTENKQNSPINSTKGNSDHLQDEFYPDDQFDDLNDLTQTNLFDHQGIIADDVNQLAEADPLEEVGLLDEDQPPAAVGQQADDDDDDHQQILNKSEDDQEDLDSPDEYAPRQLRGAKAKKRVWFPDVNASFMAW